MVCQSLQLTEVIWNRCLSSPYVLDRSCARLREVGMLFLDHCIQIKQVSILGTSIVGVVLNVLRKTKMRKCKRLLKQGPLCIQETKWSGSQKETVHQHIPGLQIAETHAIRTRQGFTLKNWRVLVDGKAVVALVSDRGSSFNIVSIHLHPEQVRQDLLAVLSAWDKCEKVEAGILVAGDFNCADEKYPELWRRWLDTLHAFDVHPTLGTTIAIWVASLTWTDA